MTTLIRATSLRGFPQLVTQLGGNPQAMLARFRIDPGLLEDDEGRMPLSTLVALLETAAQELDCADFGLRMAEYQDLHVLGAVALIARNATTVGAALEEIARFIAYHSPGVEVELDRSDADAPRLVVEIRLSGTRPRRQMQDLALGVAHNTLCLLCGKDFRARSLLLASLGELPPARYRRYFGCAVYAGQSCHALVLREEQLAQHIEAQDPLLHRVLHDYFSAQELNPALGLAQQVEKIIQRLLPTQRCRLAVVAEQLGLHERVLQRRLAEEGEGFEGLLERTRQARARDYLAERRMPMSQVAGLLGYSEQSVFNRACRRWFGTTPRGLRRQLLEQARDDSEVQADRL
ncbi:AraC family transcriptional regulator [Enterobacterales bacterium AE_CKDN230030158-1A_HGKHYDSX7]